MKIYTKTGDKGTTSLVGGTRVPKTDSRLEAYGTVDELNSWLGFVLSLSELDAEASAFIVRQQNCLFDLGCALATEATSAWQPAQLTENHVGEVEREIDRLETCLPAHDRFILPGGTKGASAANIARTVCRRAERIMSALPAGTYPGEAQALAYVNRLSDYLFVLARYINHKAGVTETYWESSSLR